MAIKPYSKGYIKRCYGRTKGIDLLALCTTFIVILLGTLLSSTFFIFLFIITLCLVDRWPDIFNENMIFNREPHYVSAYKREKFVDVEYKVRVNGNVIIPGTKRNYFIIGHSYLILFRKEYISSYLIGYIESTKEYVFHTETVDTYTEVIFFKYLSNYLVIQEKYLFTKNYREKAEWYTPQAKELIYANATVYKEL